MKQFVHTFPKNTLIPGGEEGAAIRKVLRLKREGHSYETIEKMMNWPDDRGNTAWKIWKKFGIGERRT